MKYVHEIAAVLGGLIGWMVGGWSILLTALLILNAFDFLSGIAANWGQISSKRGFEGAIKKGMMWVWIVVANLVYLVLEHQGLDIGEVIPNAVAILFIISEITSLGENSIKLGINIPEPIQKGLAIFNDRKGANK